MPDYTLKGRIAQNAGISLRSPIDIFVKDPNIGEISAKANITADQITIICTVSRELRGMDFAIIHLFATSAIEGIIDLISIKRGWVLNATLVTIIHPDGRHEDILKKFPFLGAEITSFELTSDDLQFVAGEIAKNAMLLQLLKNMTEALAKPSTATVNCNIVVEGIRNLICQNAESKDAWPIMRNKLNLTENYIRGVTGASRNARHGREEIINNRILTEVMKRTWVIFNRYIEFQKTPGADRLDIEKFPTL